NRCSRCGDTTVGPKPPNGEPCPQCGNTFRPCMEVSEKVYIDDSSRALARIYIESRDPRIDSRAAYLVARLIEDGAGMTPYDIESTLREAYREVHGERPENCDSYDLWQSRKHP